MRNFTLALMSAISAAVLFSSCDQCLGILGKAKVECHNGGTCNNGQCDCLKGYFGTHCDSIDLCVRNDVVCYNGECLEGVCICTDGFEGEDCSVESRLRYLGEYYMVEGCEKLDTFNNVYLRIESDPFDPALMQLVNLCNYNQFPTNGFFSSITARPIAGTDNFNIPYQKPDGENTDKSIEGSGTITVIDSVTTIDISYTITRGTKMYSCTVSAQKI